jgi:hypothetical protein
MELSIFKSVCTKLITHVYQYSFIAISYPQF